MNKESFFLMSVIVCCISLLSFANIDADTIVPDIIKFSGSTGIETRTGEGFSSVYEGPVSFAHKRHMAVLGPGCGNCHHDDEGKPCIDLKSGDEVIRCIECHPKKGIIRGKAESGLSDEDMIEYRANAMHRLCLGCHKEFNWKHHNTKSPMSCATCHEMLKKANP